MHNSSFLSEVFMKKSVLCCSKCSLRGLKKVTQSCSRALLKQILMFQQEVTILSRDTPSKAVISPLLPLNSFAVAVEKGFLRDEAD